MSTYTYNHQEQKRSGVLIPAMITQKNGQKYKMVSAEDIAWNVETKDGVTINDTNDLLDYVSNVKTDVEDIIINNGTVVYSIECDITVCYVGDEFDHSPSINVYKTVGNTKTPLSYNDVIEEGITPIVTSTIIEYSPSGTYLNGIADAGTHTLVLTKDDNVVASLSISVLTKPTQPKTYTIYTKSDTQPATPTGGIYNPTTGVVTLPTGWTTNVDSLPEDSKIWFSIGTIYVTGDTSTSTWSTPQLFFTKEQIQKQNKFYSAGVEVYKTVSTKKIKHTNQWDEDTLQYLDKWELVKNDESVNAPIGGSYNFDAGTFAPPTGWSTTVLKSIEEYIKQLDNNIASSTNSSERDCYKSMKEQYTTYVSYNNYTVEYDGNVYSSAQSTGWTTPQEYLNIDNILSDAKENASMYADSAYNRAQSDIKTAEQRILDNLSTTDSNIKDIKDVVKKLEGSVQDFVVVDKVVDSLKDLYQWLRVDEPADEDNPDVTIIPNFSYEQLSASEEYTGKEWYNKYVYLVDERKYYKYMASSIELTTQLSELKSQVDNDGERVTTLETAVSQMTPEKIRLLVSKANQLDATWVAVSEEETIGKNISITKYHTEPDESDLIQYLPMYNEGFIQQGLKIDYGKYYKLQFDYYKTVWTVLLDGVGVQSGPNIADIYTYEQEDYPVEPSPAVGKYKDYEFEKIVSERIYDMLFDRPNGYYNITIHDTLNNPYEIVIHKEEDSVYTNKSYFYRCDYPTSTGFLNILNDKILLGLDREVNGNVISTSLSFKINGDKTSINAVSDEIVLTGDTIAAAITAKDLNISNTTYLKSNGDVLLAQGVGKKSSLFLADGSGHLAGGKVSWDTDGNVEVKGKISSRSGNIGGWTIDNSVLQSESDTDRYKSWLYINPSSIYCKYGKKTQDGLTMMPIDPSWAINATGDAHFALNHANFYTDGSFNIGTYKYYKFDGTEVSKPLITGPNTGIMLPYDHEMFCGLSCTSDGDLSIQGINITLTSPDQIQIGRTDGLINPNGNPTFKGMVIDEAGTKIIGDLNTEDIKVGNDACFFKGNGPDAGSGYLAQQNIKWDEAGNVEVKGKIHANSGEFNGDVVANSMTVLAQDMIATGEELTGSIWFTNYRSALAIAHADKIEGASVTLTGDDPVILMKSAMGEFYILSPLRCITTSSLKNLIKLKLAELTESNPNWKDYYKDADTDRVYEDVLSEIELNGYDTYYSKSTKSILVMTLQHKYETKVVDIYEQYKYQDHKLVSQSLYAIHDKTSKYYRGFVYTLPAGTHLTVNGVSYTTSVAVTYIEESLSTQPEISSLYNIPRYTTTASRE